MCTLSKCIYLYVNFFEFIYIFIRVWDLVGLVDFALLCCVSMEESSLKETVFYSVVYHLRKVQKV